MVIKVFQGLVAVLLLLGLLKYMAVSLHWPIISDTQEMLYINFLIHHGMVPYRDLTDINMPGVYLFHAVAARIFGPSDVDWRICEFFLGFVLIAAMTVIARPYSLLAGPLAGILFILVHGSHGPVNAVQRDEVMAVFAVAGYAALFESLRRRWPWLAGIFGLLVGFATTIKPSIAPLAVVVLVAAAYGARTQGFKFLPYMLYAVAGLTAGVSTAVLYLWYYHAGPAFLFLTRKLALAYVRSNSATWGDMTSRLLPHPLKDFFLLALATGLVRLLSRRKRSMEATASARWEQAALLGGVFVGLASYYLQHKGIYYQMYPFYAFLLLWVCIGTCNALRAPGLARWLAVAAISYAVLRSVPTFIQQAETYPNRDRFANALEADLRQLKPERLDNQVQCLDVVYGCMAALYHDRIVQYSGYTGDLLLFVPVQIPVIAYFREKLIHQMLDKPPAVFVLANDRWGDPDSFNKLDAWPEFKQYLEKNYTLTTQREFIGDAEPPVSPLGSDPKNIAYRLYIRNDSPLLRDAPHTPSR
jgi:hypothetical protein